MAESACSILRALIGTPRIGALGCTPSLFSMEWLLLTCMQLAGGILRFAQGNEFGLGAANALQITRDFVPVNRIHGDHEIRLILSQELWAYDPRATAWNEFAVA